MKQLGEETKWDLYIKETHNHVKIMKLHAKSITCKIKNNLSMVGASINSVNAMFLAEFWHITGDENEFFGASDISRNQEKYSLVKKGQYSQQFNELNWKDSLDFPWHKLSVILNNWLIM